jgi:hypothetical protein
MGQNLSQFISAHQAELWSLVTVILAALVARIFRLRPKLYYSVDHSTNILVDQPLLDNSGNQLAPQQLVRTASITVQNTGLIPARGVEVAFNWKPQILNLSPARAYKDVKSSFDRYSLIFESFAPGERSTIEIMSINAELPIMTAVRADDCVGKLIPMAPQRVWPQWMLTSVTIVMFLGAATLVYLLIKLVEFLVS